MQFAMSSRESNCFLIVLPCMGRSYILEMVAISSCSRLSSSAFSSASLAFRFSRLRAFWLSLTTFCALAAEMPVEA